MKTIRDSFEECWRLDENTGCKVWIRSLDGRGYGQLYNGIKNYRAHRFAWEKINGPITDGLFVCHKCDNPACINVEHLFLGTNTENRHDSVKKGRAAHAERHGHAKLNRTDVERIKDIWRIVNKSQSEIAKYFNVSQTQISRIVNNSRWCSL